MLFGLALSLLFGFGVLVSPFVGVALVVGVLVLVVLLWCWLLFSFLGYADVVSIVCTENELRHRHNTHR